MQMTLGEPSGRGELHQFKSVLSFSVANVVETAILELDYSPSKMHTITLQGLRHRSTRHADADIFNLIIYYDGY